MWTVKYFSRRRILKVLASVLFVSPAHFFVSLIKSRRTYLHTLQKPLEIPLDQPMGISFHGQAIVFRNSDGYHVFSAKCTHLGCLVTHKEDNMLVCPCHGSRYSFEGKILRGPATKNLVPLKFQINTDKRKLIIERTS